MIDFGDKTYYFDLEALTKVITIKPKTKKTELIDLVSEFNITTTYDGGGNLISTLMTETKRENMNVLDGPKYDVLRLCIETIIDFRDELDDTLGADRAFASTPLSYKMAFNTLIKAGILKEQE